MHKLATKRGGKCRSDKYIDSKTKLRWECAEGHAWEAKPNDIKSSGSWCPQCSGKAKLTIEQMHTIAAVKGGKCLSKKYDNNYTKLQWECAEGDAWEATPNSVKKGSWCPECARSRRSTMWFPSP